MPNVLVVLYDDTGQGAWSPYGGRIEMPTFDRLAANGLTYSQWHTTALCSPTRSTFRRYIDEEMVAEDEIRTVLGHFSLCGEGLCIGYDSADPVSSMYSNGFAFTGGEIRKVVFDIADDAYVDVERQLAAAMARD